MIHFLLIHWWQIILTGGLTALGGLFYRIGGSSDGQRWERQVGDGICTILVLTIWCGWNWWCLLIMGTIWVTTTYFKWQSKTNFFTWCAVGFSFGMVPLPYMFTGQAHWLGFWIRTGILTIATGVVVGLFGGKVGFSEGFRGGVQIITLPLLLI